MDNFWTLVRFELKKILCRKITWISFGLVFSVMLAIGFYNVLAAHEVNGVNVTAHEEEMQIKAEEKKLAGRLINDEFLEELLAARKKGDTEFVAYKNIYREIVLGLSDIVVESKSHVNDLKETFGIAEEEEYIYTLRRRYMQKKFANQYLKEGEIQYWKDVLDNEESIPWTYDYYQGMRFTWESAHTAIVLIALILAASLSNLFAYEHQKRTDQLTLCSRNGRKVLFVAKTTAGVLFALISTGLVLLAAAVPQLILYGLDGWNAPIQLFIPTSLVQMTFGEMILYTYTLVLIASLMYCAVILCCSEVFRNGMVAVTTVIVVLVLIPKMITVPYEHRVLSQIFALNPINVVAIWGQWDCRLVPFFGTYLTVHQVAPVLYIVLAVVFVLIGRRAYLRFQVSGR